MDRSRTDSMSSWARKVPKLNTIHHRPEFRVIQTQRPSKFTVKPITCPIPHQSTAPRTFVSRLRMRFTFRSPNAIRSSLNQFPIHSNWEKKLQSTAPTKRRICIVLFSSVNVLNDLRQKQQSQLIARPSWTHSNSFSSISIRSTVNSVASSHSDVDTIFRCRIELLAQFWSFRGEEKKNQMQQKPNEKCVHLSMSEILGELINSRATAVKSTSG